MQSTEVANVEYLEALHDQGVWELATRVAELEAERDALAAHVDQMSAAISNALPRRPASEARAELRNAYNDAPTTSLARRYLLKQAEILEFISSDVKSMHPKASPVGIGVNIGIEAKKLRRQANRIGE